MSDLRFQKLTPTSNVDLNAYEEGFEFIFSNDDIRNIAVSGPYSSGKSSLLESYKKKHPQKTFIHISLAHFTNENKDNEEKEIAHKDIVQEIIKKMKYYNPEYIKCLMNETGVLFKDKNEIYRLLYGGYANPNEFGKRPLSKFIKDIYYDTKEMLNGLDVFSEDENTN